MKSVISAAIYARISSDKAGDGLGVTRQLEDCRRLAAERGWVVGEEYVDNNISAFRDNNRPAFQRMLSDIAEGQRDAVIAYHQDRVTRKPLEWEQFLDVCDRAGVSQFVTVTSDVDFGNDNAMMAARFTSIISANESARKSERVKRKIQQNVELGRPNGGSVRPFGFESDRVTIRESEAKIVRALVDRFLAGESLRSLAVWLTDQGISTSTGKSAWITPTLRGMLLSGRIAGMRDYKQQIATKAIWDPIISMDKHNQIVARFQSKAVSGRRSPRRYLLSGMLRCGKCATTLWSAPRENTRRYVCLSGPDHGGCGKLTVVAAPVEEWIAAAVLYRLDTPAMRDALAGRAAEDERHSALLGELQTATAKMSELSVMWSTDEISRAEWIDARKPLEARVADAERQIAHINGANTIDGLVGQGGDLRDRWETLNLDRQVAIVRAVLDYATILPGIPGVQQVFRPERIVPTWRV